MADTLTFCLQRNNSHKVEQLKGAFKGLSDLPKLQENYTAVLSALWSENDSKKKLQWLREHAVDLHPLLMYELAIEEFKVSTTIETLNTVSAPLIRSASFRVLQDLRCFDSSSLIHAPKFLEELYVKALRREVRVEMMESYVLSQNMRLSKIHSKLKEVALLSMSMNLPSPKWIAKGSMHSENHWKALRDQVALEFL